MAAADTARKLIAKKGRQDGVLRRPKADNVATADRPWAPIDSNPAADPVVATGLAVVILDASQAHKPETLTPSSTAVAYMAVGIDVHLGDILETKGDRYLVLKAELLAPGPDDVLYTLHLKG